MSVHKYPIDLGDWVSVRMPKGAEPLCVQDQHGSPYLWARVDPDAPSTVHHFRIAGTGHDLGSNVGRYIGTFQMAGGALVFHVFAEAGERHDPHQPSRTSPSRDRVQEPREGCESGAGRDAYFEDGAHEGE